MCVYVKQTKLRHKIIIIAKKKVFRSKSLDNKNKCISIFAENYSTVGRKHKNSVFLTLLLTYNVSVAM